MVKDKGEGEGEGTKPSLEATGISKIQYDTVKVREAEAKDISPLRLDKKEDSLPLAKIQRRCRLYQIFGATKFGFHPAPCVTCLPVQISHRRYHPDLLDCCQSNTCSIAAGARSWIGRLCFFFSSTAGAIHTCSIAAGARLRIYRSRGLLFIVSF